MNNIIDILTKINSIYNKKKILTDINPIVNCIELYEFEIFGYNKIEQTKFFDILNSDLNECGIIKKKIGCPEDNYKDEISSCDIIKSNNQDGGTEFKSFYNVYKNTSTKNNDSKYFNEIMKTDASSFSEITRKALEINCNYLEKRNICLYGIEGSEFIKNINDLKNMWKRLETVAMVFNIKLKKTDKVIVFGDFHGSFHTFLRHMIRLNKLNIIDIKTFKISEDYIIIFLGDILDRGFYATEIILFIYKLIINNNTGNLLKVILNRGNHETSDMYLSSSSRSFINELIQKNLLTNETQFDDFKLFITSCPSAIIIENDNNKYWLSHGGFPFLGDYKNNRHSIFDFKEFQHDVIFFDNIDDEFKFGDQVRWNDFGYHENDFYRFNKSRQTGYIIYNKLLSKFLKINNFQFVIRGHQDNYSNSWILYSKNNNIKKMKDKNKEVYHDEYDHLSINKCYDKNFTGIINMNTKIELKKRLAVHGPIARIELDGLNWRDGKIIDNEDKLTIYPVLTLSTNTDYDRILTHDSFGIIRFDLKKTDMKTFTPEINILDTRKETKKFEY